MRHQGWQVWELRPQGNAPIGIAAVAYFFTGISEPWVVLPINAAVFSMAAVSLYGIFTSLASRRLAFIAMLPFVMFPSAALIYGQIHKDVFSIAGVLVIVFVWAQFAQLAESGWRSVLGRVALTGLGCLMVWAVRPYLLQVLMAASALTVLLLGWMTGRGRGMLWWAGILLCLLVQVGYNQRSAPPSAQTTLPPRPSPSAQTTSSYMETVAVKLNEARVGFAKSAPYAGSNIDTNVHFDSLMDVVSYVPRALQVGWLAPFPSMWLGGGVSPGSDAIRFISGIEMAISYVLLVGFGLLLHGLKDNRSVLLIAVLMTMVMLLCLSLVVCNVGTLYRMRYGSWQLLNGLGILGWGLKLQARSKAGCA
jgi:hypothetical protein